MEDVFIWAEQRDSNLFAVSLEVLNKAGKIACEIGGRLNAVLIGADCKRCAEELIYHGAQKIFLVENPLLELYQSDVYAKILSGILAQYQPEIVLIGGTTVGMDIAPRVAASLNTGLTAHCVDLYIEHLDGNRQLIQVVPGWGGRMMLKIVCPEKRPQIATIKPGIMNIGKPDYERTGEIVELTPTIRETNFQARTLEFIPDDDEGLSIDTAERIVAGGFGLYSSGGFELIERLAQVLRAEVAGTRPAFDHGWIPESRIIGQSGKTVHPKLFISIGTSGAIHFTTGFHKAEVVIAINKNPDAPIFEIADIGIIDDLKIIIPLLTEEIKKLTKRKEECLN